jgi:hypothetical protein
MEALAQVFGVFLGVVLVVGFIYLYGKKEDDE